MKFFSQLFAGLCAIASGKAGKPVHLGKHYRRGLVANPMLQRRAMVHGNARRRAWHQKCALQGYDAKIRLVDAGKGNHTLAGIPQWYLEQRNQPASTES